MKKGKKGTLIALITVCAMLFGCAGAGAAAPGAPEKADKPEAAQTESTATESTATESTETNEATKEEPEQPEDEYNMPEDFVQFQSGKLEFKDFDEIISCLKDGQGYAYIKVYGYDGDVLAVAEQVFLADHSAPEASLYAMKDGKPHCMGMVVGNGSAYPLRLEDGIIYGGDNHNYDTYFLSESAGIPGIMQKDAVYDGIDSDGEFGGFMRDENVFDKDKDFTGGQKEFDALIAERESKPVIEFTIIGEESGSASALPAYKYTGTEEMYAEVSDYLIKEIAPHFEEAGVCIPYFEKVAVDDSNKDDIIFYGSFWVDNFDKNGDTLEFVSGGHFPGAIHLKKLDNGYEALKMDMVEDGSAFEPSAKKIYGKYYDDFMKIYSDSDANEEVRKQFISDYVKSNNLDIKAYKDYGWDPVSLE